jgi:hypothetical protein
MQAEVLRSTLFVMPNNTKTKAKRMGIKSVIAHGKDEQGRTQLAITAFGKGNDAELAIQTDEKGSNLAQKYEERNITAKKIVPRGIETGGTIAGEYCETHLTNPANNPGEDYLKLKSTLEKEFFGQEFPGDNVRIQIIHQILDVQKLLGIYITDIIYCINNLRDETHLDEESDIVGLSMNDDDKLKINLGKMLPYLGFFGDAFRMPPKPKKDKSGKIINQGETSEDVHNKNVLRVLGTMRQTTAHYRNATLPFTKDGKLAGKFKKFAEVEKKNPKGKVVKDTVTKWDAWHVVEEHYANIIQRINDGFCTNAALNLQFLTQLIPAESKEQLTEDYYRFSILKEGKNLGVNMKHLREVMFGKYYPDVKDKQHDSYRAKIYGLSDFLLFKHFGGTATDEWTPVLRETSDEKAKEKLYEGFAETAWQAVGESLKTLIDNLQSYFKKKNEETVKTKQPVLSASLIARVVKKTANFTSFAKLLAFLCNFWEGKEINELLSAYIHKFENIQMFIDTLGKLEGKKPQFSDNYALFNEAAGQRAGEIARNLRVLASIGKMKPDLDDAKRQLYKAAIETLGISADDYVSDQWLEENVLLNKTEPGYNNRKTDVNPFRNFIAKQVVQSRRFMYLVRYTKPKAVRAVMSNRAIVRYVLSRIADIQDVHITESQIDSYYQNLPQHNENATTKQKIDALADYLCQYSFEKNVFAQKKGIVLNSQSRDKNVAIEQLKALTGLYLTVAYIAIKNLIKANARYYIAFAAFERDYAMFEKKLGENTLDKYLLPFKFTDSTGKEKEGKNESFALTEHLLDGDDENPWTPYVWDENKNKGENWKALRQHIKKFKKHWHFTRKWRDIFRQDIESAKKVNPTGLLLTTARNDAAHLRMLEVIAQYAPDFRKDSKGEMESYFELYHFLLQKRMLDKESGLNLKDYKERIDKYRSACKDLVKITYISLGYNLARYKNLTIDALFDEDSKEGKERKRKSGAVSTPR